MCFKCVCVCGFLRIPLIPAYYSQVAIHAHRMCVHAWLRAYAYVGLARTVYTHTVYDHNLLMSLPKSPHVNRIYKVLANPMYMPFIMMPK